MDIILEALIFGFKMFCGLSVIMISIISVMVICKYITYKLFEKDLL